MLALHYHVVGFWGDLQFLGTAMLRAGEAETALKKLVAATTNTVVGNILARAGNEKH